MALTNKEIGQGIGGLGILIIIIGLIFGIYLYQIHSKLDSVAKAIPEGYTERCSNTTIIQHSEFMPEKMDMGCLYKIRIQICQDNLRKCRIEELCGWEQYEEDLEDLEDCMKRHGDLIPYSCSQEREKCRQDIFDEYDTDEGWIEAKENNCTQPSYVYYWNETVCTEYSLVRKA